MYSAFPVIGLPWQIIPFKTCEVARQSKRYHEQLVASKEANKDELWIKGKILKDHLSKIYRYEYECRIEVILETLGWSRWTLRTIANNALGGSVSRYLAKLGEEKAVELLLTTQLQIQEIALKIGFPPRLLLSKLLKGLRVFRPMNTGAEKEAISRNGELREELKISQEAVAFELNMSQAA
ncbi:hypothetical protein H8B06_16440 [Sphingobacterium sp. DN00404]|uniref:HTH araC/xylS-type domain-containing protein n=1 Tax=Sphingobacterium micropteri TaxID=2763501 RepID=A0ABR7YT71_9SPHI|nr:hypothetical protein [Sphingobacterium micropteri]MBD1434421.1 hypothetical protein [Sphingobacterium micropteri]